METDRKIIWGAVLATVVIVVGAIWFFAKSDSLTSTPTTDLNEKEKLLTVTSEDYVQGNKEANVTLIEYLDFECQVCGTYYPLMNQLAEEFKGEVRFVNRYFPLTIHKNGMNAALAVESASRQGKYWEMDKILFENQKAWGAKEIADPTLFDKYAKQIGLNLDQFKKDFYSAEVRNRIGKDQTSGEKLGVDGTPSFFLNGERLQNPRNIADFKVLIKAAILKTPKVSEKQLGEKTHEHADIKMYLKGKQLDLTQAKYQSTEAKEINDNVHLHDGNGNVIHKHRKGVTLGYFFNTLKIDFNKDCLILDTGVKYCNDDKNSLKFLINGKPNDTFENYEFLDLDRILISYGPKEEDLSTQLKSVTDAACLYSEKCLERGKPPSENCVGGLGSDCVDKKE